VSVKVDGTELIVVSLFVFQFVDFIKHVIIPNYVNVTLDGLELIALRLFVVAVMQIKYVLNQKHVFVSMVGEELIVIFQYVLFVILFMVPVLDLITVLVTLDITIQMEMEVLAIPFVQTVTEAMSIVVPQKHVSVIQDIREILVVLFVLHHVELISIV
jgi:hypothetical protein